MILSVHDSGEQTGAIASYHETTRNYGHLHIRHSHQMCKLTLQFTTSILFPTCCVIKRSEEHFKNVIKGSILRLLQVHTLIGVLARKCQRIERCTTWTLEAKMQLEVKHLKKKNALIK